MIAKRGSGLLLHITSLPSKYGIGDLGPEAYRFVDFLAGAGQTYWQILPLNPTSLYTANSPYASYSAFAGNPLLISPERLVEEGFIEESDLEHCERGDEEAVDYENVTRCRKNLLRKTYDRNRSRLDSDDDFSEFCEHNQAWLDPCSLFVALKDRFGGIPFTGWSDDIRDRDAAALGEWRKNLSDRIVEEKFTQYLFFRQWNALRQYCNEQSIQIIGDLPIYVSHDSADVWSNPEVFKLGHEREMTVVAGVPPDYFSETGQLWGNPVYDWEELQSRNFDWWCWRIEHNLRMFDIFRLDHFRGFVAYWEVPVDEDTAINGEWIPVPVDGFLDTLLKRFPDLPMIAEDLGIITDDVREIMKKYGFPGMKVLQFAFGEDLETHPYLPHNHTKNCVVYTGTHDNNTTLGWLHDDATEDEKARLEEYLQKDVSDEDLPWTFAELAMASKANTAIVPVQDLLNLDTQSRMNTPSTTTNNWRWRLLPGNLTEKVKNRLLALVQENQRLST